MGEIISLIRLGLFLGLVIAIPLFFFKFLKGKSPTVPSIFSVIWAIIVTIIGGFVSLGILDGFASPSFFLFVLRFLLFGLVLGLIASAPFSFLIKNSSEKPTFRKILIAMALITFVLPSFMLLKITDLTKTKFIPIPIPPHIKDYEYKFEMRDGITPTSVFMLKGDTSVTLEEGVERAKKTAKFFEELVDQTGGGMYGSDYVSSYSFCTTAIESSYQRFKEEVKDLEETPFGYIDPVTKNYRSVGVGVDCGFTIRMKNILPVAVSYYAKIGKGGGAEIQFSSQDFSRYRP